MRYLVTLLMLVSLAKAQIPVGILTQAGGSKIYFLNLNLQSEETYVPTSDTWPGQEFNFMLQGSGSITNTSPNPTLTIGSLTVNLSGVNSGTMGNTIPNPGFSIPERVKRGISGTIQIGLSGLTSSNKIKVYMWDAPNGFRDVRYIEGGNTYMTIFGSNGATSWNPDPTSLDGWVTYSFGDGFVNVQPGAILELRSVQVIAIEIQ